VIINQKKSEAAQAEDSKKTLKSQVASLKTKFEDLGKQIEKEWQNFKNFGTENEQKLVTIKYVKDILTDDLLAKHDQADRRTGRVSRRSGRSGSSRKSRSSSGYKVRKTKNTSENYVRKSQRSSKRAQRSYKKGKRSSQAASYKVKRSSKKSERSSKRAQRSSKRAQRSSKRAERSSRKARKIKGPGKSFIQLNTQEFSQKVEDLKTMLNSLTDKESVYSTMAVTLLEVAEKKGFSNLRLLNKLVEIFAKLERNLVRFRTSYEKSQKKIIDDIKAQVKSVKQQIRSVWNMYKEASSVVKETKVFVEASEKNKKSIESTIERKMIQLRSWEKICKYEDKLKASSFVWRTALSHKINKLSANVSLFDRPTVRAVKGAFI
jgi:hypothetical protein